MLKKKVLLLAHPVFLYIFFLLTLPLCVELEGLALLAPPVDVPGRHPGLVGGVRPQPSERVGLLVEVPPGALRDVVLHREAQVVPGVSAVRGGGGGRRGPPGGRAGGRRVANPEPGATARWRVNL